MIKKSLILLVSLLLAVSGSVFADDYVWTGEGDGISWDDGGNWDGGTEDFPYPDHQDDDIYIAGQDYSVFLEVQMMEFDEIMGNNLFISHGSIADGGQLNIEEDAVLELAGSLSFGGDGTGDSADNGIVNINSGTLIAGQINNYGSGHQLNLNNGTIDLTGILEMGSDGDSNNPAVVSISGGTLNASDIRLCRRFDAPSHAVMNMTGGTVNLTNNLNVPFWREDGNATAHIQFDSGTINIENRLWIYNREDRGYGTIDMTGDAKMTVGEDWTGRINGWISDGQMTAYGGEGYFIVDYDPGTDQTTVTVSEVPIIATEYYWTGDGDGNSWDDGANWAGDGTELYPYPDHQQDSSTIGGGYEVIIDGDTGEYDGEILSEDLYLGHPYYSEPNGMLTVDAGGLLELSGDAYVGFGDATGGVLNVNSEGKVTAGTAGV